MVVPKVRNAGHLEGRPKLSDRPVMVNEIRVKVRRQRTKGALNALYSFILFIIAYEAISCREIR
jgi:hypothetical protein